MSRHIPYKNLKEYKPELIEKGSTDALRIDKEEIERTIIILRDNYTLKLNNLSENLTLEINKLKQWAKSLFGLDTYTDFYRIIMKHFSDINEILPETIGAFCYGCNVGTSFTSLNNNIKACSPTCINSIPTPNMPQFVTCTSNVVLLYRDNGKYKLKKLKNFDNSQFTYLFLMDDDITIPIDYDIIKKFGIKNYSLYTCLNGVYKHIKTENLSLSLPLPLKTRKNKYYPFGILVLIILIIILLIFISKKKF